MRLTLAIPTFNNFSQVAEALITVARNTDFDGRLVVVNNGDKTLGGTSFVEEIHRLVPYEVTVLEPGRNLGWAGGVNLALEHTDTELFCMCNDDVLFVNNRHFWESVYRWMDWLRAEGLTNVGGVGPVSNYVAGYQNMHMHGMPDVYVAPLLIGFCAVYRTDLLKRLGGLDESLPGGDDYDLSIRVRDAGYNLVVDRNLFVFHYGSQTGRRLHEGYWDSKQHQMDTINALVRKHSLRKWYDTLNGTIFEINGNWGFRTLSIDQAYREARHTPSDMYEHMETLRTFGSMVKHITEFGTDDGTSATAWLAAKPEKLVCYDIRRRPEVDKLYALANGTTFEFHQQDTLEADIEPTDLLFVDDLHTYDQVRRELERHASKVRRYILFHDVESTKEVGDLGERGIMPAITEFLREHQEWRVLHYVTYNNGLMALVRVPA